MASLAKSIIVLILSLNSLGGMAHPLKMSLTVIKYDSEDKSLELGTKVFADDFQRSMFRTVLNGVDTSKLTEEKKRGFIENYFNTYYGISVNGTPTQLKLKSSEFAPQQYGMIFKFISPGVSIKQGDTLEVKNQIFFEDFGLNQTNNILVTIPEYKVNERRVARIGKDTFTYKIGDSEDGWFSRLFDYWMGTHR